MQPHSSKNQVPIKIALNTPLKVVAAKVNTEIEVTVVSIYNSRSHETNDHFYQIFSCRFINQ